MPKPSSSNLYHYRVLVVLDHVQTRLRAEFKRDNVMLFGSLSPIHSQGVVDEMLHNLTSSYRLKQMDLDVRSYAQTTTARMKSRVGMYKLLKSAGAI